MVLSRKRLQVLVRSGGYRDTRSPQRGFPRTGKRRAATHRLFRYPRRKSRPIHDYRRNLRQTRHLWQYQKAHESQPIRDDSPAARLPK